MTNNQKHELRQLAKEGVCTAQEMADIVECSIGTARKYKEIYKDWRNKK